jgi:hypothetical protein
MTGSAGTSANGGAAAGTGGGLGAGGLGAGGLGAGGFALAKAKDPNANEGFGGDLTYGEIGPGAGLRGADKICERWR